MQAPRQQSVGRAEEAVQQAPVTKRAAPTQLVPESTSSSDAATLDEAAEDILRELEVMKAEEQARRAALKGDTAGREWQMAGRGGGDGRGGTGRAVMGVGGSRGAGKGQKGKGGNDVIAWLCAFCNTPTGPTTEHQRKYCEHLFRPPPVHEVSRARCAFCGHGHLFSECPILAERGGGIFWLPRSYLDMCEFQGYPTFMIGQRKVLRIQSLLPTAPSPPLGRFSESSGSFSSSQGSDLTSASASELSLVSTNPDMQQLVSFVSEQHNRLTEQMAALTESVKKLADGQEALSEVGAATCSAVVELRKDVKVQLAENKRDTEAAMTRTLARCNEALRMLGHRSSGSGDTGVSDPPGASSQT